MGQVISGDGTEDIVNGYEFIKELGRGGQGRVCLVRDLRTQELVALKTQLPQTHITDDSRERFLREIKTVQQLHHPNIVGFVQAGFTNDVLFFVTEFCEGGSVNDLMSRTGAPLPVDVAIPITLQALDGLRYAHQVFIDPDAQGFVHRDIKPDNILLKGSGAERVAKVGDFGLAKAFDRAGLSGLSLSGNAAGTLPFMSRKQLVNFKYAKPDVDVWSMAATLYWMLTGREPRDVLPGADPVMAILDEQAVPIRNRNPNVPARLAEVIDAALIDDVGAELATAQGLATAIGDATYS